MRFSAKLILIKNFNDGQIALCQNIIITIISFSGGRVSMAIVMLTRAILCLKVPIEYNILKLL